MEQFSFGVLKLKVKTSVFQRDTPYIQTLGEFEPLK
jgi:hypothetical protein